MRGAVIGRGQLHQHAVAGARVQEADAAGEAAAGRGVQEGHVLAAQGRQVARHVGGLEAHVMEALAALVEKAADRRAGREGLEQLDLGLPRRE